jgi:two-component system LytT family response regulator
MRTVIVDDDPIARSQLLRLCEEQPDLDVVAQAGSGTGGIQAIRTHRPDLVLLDIELNDLTGFDVLRSPEIHPNLVAIVITGHPEHALPAFEHEAVDCLTKPIEPRRFIGAIERARRRLSGAPVHRSHYGGPSPIASTCNAVISAEPRVLAEKGRRLYLLGAKSIDYIEVEGNYVTIHVGADRYLSRNTLKHLGATLAPLGFIRVDRSLLINLAQVAYVETLPQRSQFAFTLRSGAQLVSGRAHRKAILRALRSTSC